MITMEVLELIRPFWHSISLIFCITNLNIIYMKNLKTMMIAMIIAVISTSNLFAVEKLDDDKKAMHEKRKAERMAEMREELGLSDEQVTQIKAIKQQTKLRKKSLKLE
jgi:hypothetical protein